VRATARFAIVVCLELGLLAGCGTTYDVVPVARAGDGAPPVKAQIRQIKWWRQPESGGLAEGASVAVEVDLYNAGPAGTFLVGPPRMEARPALGGPSVAFELREEVGGGFGVPSELSRAAYGDSAGPSPGLVLAPGVGRTVRATFDVPQRDLPRGPQRLVVVVPVRGAPDLEIAVADPVPGGPRWPKGPPVGVYAFSKFGGVGRLNLDAMEPVGLAVRMSRGRWIVGVGATATYLYRQELAGGPPAFGTSLHAQLTWQPWRWTIAPYVEAGTFLGFQEPPPAYFTPAHGLVLPRLSYGAVWTFGSRLGSAGALPFERPLSAQRVFGIRLGLTQWFNTNESSADGLEIVIERGFGP
jgi:hypothetical protein